MKDFLPDTHALLWMQDDNPALSNLALKILSDNSNNLYVSVSSFWEITIKQSLGKLELAYTLDELKLACKATNIVIVPIEIEYLNILKSLPFIHRDPFDRIIIATAMSLNYSLISKDEYFGNYDLDVVW